MWQEIRWAKFGIFTFTFSLVIAVANAEERQQSKPYTVVPFIEHGWARDPHATSGGLVATGWKLLGTAGLSWPDGRQAVVTFWISTVKEIVRCIDYFDADMTATGGKCVRQGGNPPL